MKGIPHGAPLNVVHQSIREMLPKAYEQPVDTRGRQPDRGSSRSTSRATPGAGSASPSSAAANPTQAKSSSSSQSRPRSFGRPRVASPSAGRPLSPARMMEQALKADPMFCPSDEDMGLFGAGAAARFSTAFYIKGDGCMDFGFSRDQQPWEASDGAVFLVRELACVHPEACIQHLQPLVDLVAAAAMNNFEGAPKLRETVWRCLPTIAKAIGRTALKRHLLEGLLGPLMDDLTCSTQLTEAAAGKAVGALRDMLGPSIFTARLSPKQVAAMQASPHIPPPVAWTSSTTVPPPSGSATGIPSILGPRLGLGHG
ncbi:hypothetical protein DUNSADRAFT_11931 [Dunaliella salina]|uniref:Uncharacterized protein n=1 Tax=Dunaliella salina TaxID=3046 RepID=A0ABQ7GCD0_DUNSA|nr:hypothetical protein DUNSADRAFT_11931 [Dunaliella salina]|eukprot:KAF5832259.1 hypothetical protein DUNSADRAFT_11931 [Dunaliella salina]